MDVDRVARGTGATPATVSNCTSFASRVETCTLDLRHDLVLARASTYDRMTQAFVVRGAAAARREASDGRFSPA